MGMDPTKLFIEFLFGMVGTGYFMYGRKAGNMVALCCGLGLGIFPYFVDRMAFILLVGGSLIAIPFVLKNR
jgi:hypothetical protein